MKLKKFQYREQIIADAEIIMAEGFKRLKTSLTVVEMANLALALMEVGVIDKRPKVEVFRAFSACFESRQQDDMSAGSMLRKYSEIDAESLDTLKRIGIDLHNYIKKQQRGTP
ncbi:MAG: hypothetical protein JST39_02630 [Bacteroidetes bacterium]|nr:hypothetical protein [Bacteroidota bacterium]